MKHSTRVKPTDFSKAVQADIKRSIFDRSSTKKTAFTAGKLVPIYVDEVLPGDTFEMSLAFVSRLATPVFPTMDNLKLEFFAFYCPNRLLWDGWEALHGENKTGPWAPSTPPALVPYINVPSADKTVEVGSLCDYLDIPVGVELSRGGDTGFKVSALPMRMYYRIWNEWFRDENLQAPVPVIYDSSNSIGIGSLPTYTKSGSLLPVNKPHDYFTSCLPQPQKGDSTLIPIELNELIPVITGSDDIPSDKVTMDSLKWCRPGGVSLGVEGYLFAKDSSGDKFTRVQTDSSYPTGSSYAVIPANLWADPRGVQATSTTISDLRTAFQLQKLYERDARGGTRYVEMLKAHFGVDAQDYRLQRSEFLGKISADMGIYQVAQTSSTDETSPQGNVSAFGYASDKRKFFAKSFVEHGYLMIFAVARQRKTYQQGIDKLWTRRDRFDFYYPALAHISEQPVYNYEIYAFGDKISEVFGYQEAWAEYRYKPSKVSGLMRTGVSGSLSAYHYADYYTSQPYLSAEWIKDNTDANLDRTLVVPSATSGYQIILDVAFALKCARPMPVYSVPGLVDHF
jgi:hypothetical protein